MNNTIYYNGRPDGIGNRIEQLINIQEYCKKYNLNCIYIWNNTFTHRTYEPLIKFDNITIKNKINENEKKYLAKKCMIRTYGNIIDYQFTFNINNMINYDIIIHIRGTDRLQPINHFDYSNINELIYFINKTIKFINSRNDINTYTVVSDDKRLLNYTINKIKKKYIQLPYTQNINKDWLDFYYLTKPNKYVLMCCKFSSFSITASILENKTLLVFPESLNSNLPRYKAKIEIIT